jgi:O-methyltransferase
MEVQQMEAPAQLYLELIKKCITRSAFPDYPYRPVRRPPRAIHALGWAVYPAITRGLDPLGLKLFHYRPFDGEKRAEGADWPTEAETMAGSKRLNNVQYCVTEVLRQNIPGDLIETGVWRGGTCILMRAILKAYGDSTRRVWVADSFEGLPKPDGRYEQDNSDRHWEAKDVLGIPLAQVQANFARYGLLDEQVQFLSGWFKDSLPTAPIQELSILRLDGDMYSSTMDALQSLYPKLCGGGYAIIDDYGAVPGCRQAVEDYRRQHDITEPVEAIDWTGVFWRKRL